jgi:mRNA interferase MazF
VLRSDHFAAHSLVTLLAFTGTATEAPSLRVRVQPSTENGLQVSSQAMIDHIQSVHVQRIEREIGRLADADMQAITRAVAVYLGFADPGSRRPRQMRTPRKRTAPPPGKKAMRRRKSR